MDSIRDDSVQTAPRFTRRQLFVTGAAGAAMLAVGTIGYRVAALPAHAPAQRGGVLTRQELATIEALALAYFPPGNAFGVDAREADVAGYLDRYLAQLAKVDQNLIRALIWLYDQGTLMSGRFRSVKRLPLPVVREYVMAWEQSRLAWRRELAMSLRTLLGMAYFAHPKAKATIGIVEPCPSAGPSLLRLRGGQA